MVVDQSRYDICTISDCSRYAVSVCIICKISFVCLYHWLDCCPHCKEREQQWQVKLRKHKIKQSKYRQKFPISNFLLTDLVVVILGVLCFGIGFFIVVQLGFFISCIRIQDMNNSYLL